MSHHDAHSTWAGDRADLHDSPGVHVCPDRYDRKLARNRVFLKAKWDLPAATEVFVSYGKTLSARSIGTGYGMWPRRQTAVARLHTAANGGVLNSHPKFLGP